MLTVLWNCITKSHDNGDMHTPIYCNIYFCRISGIMEEKYGRAWPMKKKIAIIITITAYIAGTCLTANAKSLSIDGMNMEIPDEWVETGNEETDGAYNISYTCGNGAMQIFTDPYDESMSSMSSVLLDSALYGIQSTEGYSEIESSVVDLGGRDAHATTFSSNEYVGMLTSVDSGTSIINILYMCPYVYVEEVDSFGDFLGTVSFGENSVGNEKNYTKYTQGNYKVGADIPAGEYVVFSSGDRGYFCVSSDSNQDDIIYNDNFDYNSIITINDGEYLELSRSYAIPITEKPDIEASGAGMFKVGIHIPAGEYKLEATDDRGYYCIYPDSRQDDIISNDNFEGQNYVTVTDGQYLVLSRCKFSEPPEKPVVTYTDADTVKRVQEALNAAGYDCGTPDGSAGNMTVGQIQKYQTDKGLNVTGTITDELLESLGI